MRIGLTNISHKIGDSLMFSALPENFFKSFKTKLIDVDHHRIYDYNPFIDRSSRPDLIIDPNLFVAEISKIRNISSCSITEGVAFAFKALCVQRTPRLYKYETDKMYLNAIVVHLNGLTNNQPISPKIVETIRNNYSDFYIYQVGTETDQYFPCFIDKRGLPFWESVKLIATCNIFIGVNSGCFHIANCYDRVRKKILLKSNNLDDIMSFRPGENTKLGGGRWVDYGVEYFNFTNVDIGVTKSFFKI